MWKKIGKACKWKPPRAPSARLLWEDKATEAVLRFLESTKVGCMVTLRRPPEEEGEDNESEKDGPGPPPGEYTFPLFFLRFVHSLFNIPSATLGENGEKERR